MRFFPSALFSHALIYICAFFRSAFFLCAFFQCAFFWSPRESYVANTHTRKLLNRVLWWLYLASVNCYRQNVRCDIIYIHIYIFLEEALIPGAEAWDQFPCTLTIVYDVLWYFPQQITVIDYSQPPSVIQAKITCFKILLTNGWHEPEAPSAYKRVARRALGMSSCKKISKIILAMSTHI